MKFDSWYFLMVIPLIPILFFWKRKSGAISYSSVAILKLAGMKKTIKHRIGDGIIALSICILLVALARPQIPLSLLPPKEDGIDIVTLLDVSGSMESVDFTPNRLEVARDTMDDFIDKRIQDRIGLVVFAGTAYTRMPLTLDHDAVLESLGGVGTESVSEEGTAIGMAISVGVNRLKKSEAKSKVIILVTDGDNNAGAISPEKASELAAELGIKIYAIGVGTDETIIPYKQFGQTLYQKYEGGLNEPLLTSVAEQTGGSYYRATNEESLKAIFDEIDQLEKSDFERDTFMQYDEHADLFIKIGLLLLVIGYFFKRYYYIQIP